MQFANTSSFYLLLLLPALVVFFIAQGKIG